MHPRAQPVALVPDILRWARERNDFTIGEMAAKMRVKPEQVEAWEASGKISFAQADRLAHVTHTPVGTLYRSRVPEDDLPITDFRGRGGSQAAKPSPNLIDTIYQMQRRTAWYGQWLQSEGCPSLDFVASCSIDDEPAAVAREIERILSLNLGWSTEASSLADAFKRLRLQSGRAGMLVVVNGIVKNNTSRKLRVEEFRGFALVNKYAPLIFVNNADSTTGKLFSLAHELVHIFVGAEGLSEAADSARPRLAIESFCNKVAAEFLMPGDKFRNAWAATGDDYEDLQTMATHYKVSIAAATIRAETLNLISWQSTRRLLAIERARMQTGAKPTRGGGGDFWKTQELRVGKEFANAVYGAARNGSLSYTEAYALTGLNYTNFEKIPEKLALGN